MSNVEASNLEITQSVVDEREKLCGRGDATLVDPASLPDPGVEVGDWFDAVVALYRFDRGPAHQPRALFGDRTPHHFGV